MINVAWFVCDDRIDVGDHVLISWNAVLMDTYRFASDPRRRQAQLERFWRDRIEADDATARPIRIGNAAWIGFDSVILPGVTIGEGSVVGCRSVVRDDVPPYTIVAGNPARVVRRIEPAEVKHVG
jgi:acetyltransferase-like isoleucine patch superfamily enzyme